LKRKSIIIYVSICLLCISCNNRKDEAQPGFQNGGELLQQGNNGYYQLFCDNFHRLNYLNKLYAWHLYSVCVSGQDIIYDQIPPTVEDSLIGSCNAPSESTIQAIRLVITELEKTVGYAPASSASSLIEFIRCLDDVCQGFPVEPSKTHTGTSDSSVDFIFGFERLASDSVISKFAFTGMVLIEDLAADSLISAHIDLNPKTCQVLYKTGKDKHCPIGRKILARGEVNATVSERFYVFSNVLETYDQSQRLSLLEDFFSGQTVQKASPEHVYNMPELELIQNRMAGVKDVVIIYRGISPD